MERPSREEALELVARHGHGLIGVLAEDEPVDPLDVGYHYTYGLTASHGLPELVLVATPPTLGAHLVNAFVERAVEERWPVQPGATFRLPGFGNDPEAGLRVGVWPVPDAWKREGEPFTVTRELYGDAFSAAQLVWADGEQRLPGEDGYAAAADQPLLAELDLP